MMRQLFLSASSAFCSSTERLVIHLLLCFCPKPKLRYFCLRQNTNVSSEEWETRERVKGVGGGEAGGGAFLPSENPFSYFQSLLFHARQRGAGHVLGPHRPGQAALLQHKVVVGSGVHGVENVGVVRDPELFVLRDFLHQLVLLGLLPLQVVFDHRLPDDGWSLVLTRHQDALVHVAVLHVQADPDDAAVIHLLVVQRQRQGGVVGHCRHRAFV